MSTQREVPNAGALENKLGVKDHDISSTPFGSIFDSIPALESKVMSLEMLSNMGVQDSPLQMNLCDEISPVLLTRAAHFKAAEVFFGSNAFLGGDTPSADDAKAFAGIHALLALLIPADRPIGKLGSNFPSLRKWFMRCRSHYAGKLPTVHCLGTPRIGSQIDRRPDSLAAAALCESATLLNKGQKKAVSQGIKRRQKRLLGMPLLLLLLHSRAKNLQL